MRLFCIVMLRSLRVEPAPARRSIGVPGFGAVTPEQGRLCHRIGQRLALALAQASGAAG
jgi:hypothetical protein